MNLEKIKMTRINLQKEIQEMQDLLQALRHLEQSSDFAKLRAHSLICRDLGVETDKIPKKLHELVYAGKLILSDSMAYYLHENNEGIKINSIREFMNKEKIGVENEPAI